MCTRQLSVSRVSRGLRTYGYPEFSVYSHQRPRNTQSVERFQHMGAAGCTRSITNSPLCVWAAFAARGSVGERAALTKTRHNCARGLSVQKSQPQSMDARFGWETCVCVQPASEAANRSSNYSRASCARRTIDAAPTASREGSASFWAHFRQKSSTLTSDIAIVPAPRATCTDRFCRAPSFGGRESARRKAGPPARDDKLRERTNGGLDVD